MQRFRDSVRANTSTIIVTGSVYDSTASRTRGGHRLVQTIDQAIEMVSKPGDIIILESGIIHFTKGGLNIKFPLYIKGSCASRPSKILAFSSCKEPVFSVQSSSKIDTLDIEGGVCGCVCHVAGKLTIIDSYLHCNGNGLEFLASPLVSRAGGSYCLGSKHVGRCPKKRQKGMNRPSTLLLISSMLTGGHTVIRIEGTGTLRDVRAICEGSTPILWFTVEG